MNASSWALNSPIHCANVLLDDCQIVLMPMPMYDCGLLLAFSALFASVVSPACVASAVSTASATTAFPQYPAASVARVASAVFSASAACTASPASAAFVPLTLASSAGCPVPYCPSAPAIVSSSCLLECVHLHLLNLLLLLHLLWCHSFHYVGGSLLR